MSLRLVTLLATVAGFATMVPAASAAVDRTVSVSTTTAKADWTGAATAGFNTTFFADGVGPVTGSCGKDTQDYCEQTLVHVTGDDVGGGTVTFRIDGFQQYSDFDLRVYESDATGELGTYLGSPNSDNASTSPLGTSDPRNTSAGDFETKPVDLGNYLDGEGGPLDAYFVVEVPYFMVANDSYAGHVILSTTPFVPDTGDGE